MAGPLDGINILDLSRVLAGPYCTMILGDLGADVIKVESPKGDDTRKWGPPFQHGISAYYLSINRNKRSIVLDLKSSEGKEELKKLVKDADVLIHNFKTGTMEAFGLDYASLQLVNEQLIYCAITGFGETGPYRDLPGYDFIIQAMSGLMSITGTADSGPQKLGVAITDILTGLYAAISIEAALLERSRSNKGQQIDLALYDTAVSALVNIASNYLMNHEIPARLGNRHANIVPYDCFETKDSQIVIAVGNDEQFKRFCSMIDLPDLAEDPRFEKNEGRVRHRMQLMPIIEKRIQSQSTAYWRKQCEKASIPSGPVQNIKEVFQDPQVRQRQMLFQCHHPVAGPIDLVASPIKLSRTPVSYRRHPPLLGEHDQAFLSKNMKAKGEDQDEL